MKLLENKYWISIILALAIGLIIGWIDTRPNWDDTGITVGLIFITSFLLGLITKRNVWLIAIIIGLCITSINFILNSNLQTAISFVIAFLGAYLGVLLKYIIRK